ncbi:MAG: signal peptide peptidase SppA [Spirochaetales bacterium]|nr:signal peptide peptidase SppA [Spirochaetales bacterium]
MNYSKLILSGTYKETGRQSKGLLSAAGSEGFRFDSFYLKVEALIHKSKVKRVLVICRQDFSAGVFGGLEEVCERLKALRRSGKELYFYTPAYGAPQLFLASVCTHRLIHPMGSVRFLGLSLSFSFLKRMMRGRGINAEILRRGKYKSAGDRFGTDSLEDAAREQYERYIQSVMSVMREEIITGFQKTDKELDALLGGEILSSEKAVSDGWIDRIITESQLENEWKKEKDKEVKIKKTMTKSRRGFSLIERRVAVLVFEGAVVDGHSRRDPIMGQAVGADSFIPQIRKLAEDRKVKAVVFRINSGGGSAFASESITAELRSLAEKKPLIVSMSEIAGSGGYWMSCCGQKTFALRTSLTGSIGVISIYISWFKLLERLGITHDTIKIGEHADAGSPLRMLTAKEREMLDAEIGTMYDNFISIVAEFRNIAKDEVDTMARGRIWSGSDALANRLVDEAGGLSAAIKTASDAARIKKPVVKFYPEITHSLIERLMMNASKEDESAAEILQSGAALGSLLYSSGALRTSEQMSTPAALMEEVVSKWI